MIGIKDFTMPKNCGECRCYDVEWARCSFLDKDTEGFDKRPTGCPLVEDVAPIVKAYWDLDDEETICSNCGTSFEGNTTVWKYCPNCGADTRGKDMQNNIMQHFIAALARSGMSQEEAEAQVKKEFGEL